MKKCWQRREETPILSVVCVLLLIFFSPERMLSTFFVAGCCWDRSQTLLLHQQLAWEMRKDFLSFAVTMIFLFSFCLDCFVASVILPVSPSPLILYSSSLLIFFNLILIFIESHDFVFFAKHDFEKRDAGGEKRERVQYSFFSVMRSKWEEFSVIFHSVSQIRSFTATSSSLHRRLHHHHYFTVHFLHLLLSSLLHSSSIPLAFLILLFMHLNTYNERGMEEKDGEWTLGWMNDWMSSLWCWCCLQNKGRYWSYSRFFSLHDLFFIWDLLLPPPPPSLIFLFFFLPQNELNWFFVLYLINIMIMPSLPLLCSRCWWWWFRHGF